MMPYRSVLLLLGTFVTIVKVNDCKSNNYYTLKQMLKDCSLSGIFITITSKFTNRVMLLNFGLVINIGCQLEST